MADSALVVRQLVKRYGRIKALDSLDLSIPRLAICGLVGQNGAGKTTTFGIVGGYIRPDAGEVDILGDGPFQLQRHRGRVTLLPQDCELSPHTPVRDLLFYYARLQGTKRAQARYQVDRVLELMALQDRATATIRQLSHGMRRRVAVAQALLGDPELVLLDEPISGLDPELVVRVREVLAAQRGQRTLVISSHNLAELEVLCDHVIFLESGRCTRSGTLTEVTGRGLTVRYLLHAPVAIELPGLDCSWLGNELTVCASAALDAADLNARVLPVLLDAGARVLEVKRGRSLETAYLEASSRGSACGPV